ncbi:MAG: hypothetical protein U5L45_17015 [Saprospiraceae bacterium]|nr:hypothetical protein [Saprospiraceae bacterium]
MCINFRISALCLLLSLFFLNAHAQNGFQKATIIDNKNDTIEGFVKFEDWYANSSFIVFKKTLNSEKKTLLPTQIKSFRVNNELYEAHTVKLQEDLKEKMDEQPLMGFKVSNDTTIFLCCLAKGSWRLYSHSIGEIGDDNFAFYMRQEDSDTLELLQYRRFARVQQGELRVGTKAIYKSQLWLHFSDYPKLRKKIEKAEYKTADIQAVVMAYNRQHTRHIQYAHQQT